MFAVCPVWHWKPGLAYWALQKKGMSCLKTSKSLSGNKYEFLCVSGLSVHRSLRSPGPSPTCSCSTAASSFIFKPKRRLVCKHCTNLRYLSIRLNSVEVQEVWHWLWQLLAQAFDADGVILLLSGCAQGNLFSRRGAGRGTGEILSHIEEQVLNKGKCRINPSFRPLLSSLKKINLVKKKLSAV